MQPQLQRWVAIRIETPTSPLPLDTHNSLRYEYWIMLFLLSFSYRLYTEIKCIIQVKQNPPEIRINKLAALRRSQKATVEQLSKSLK